MPSLLDEDVLTLAQVAAMMPSHKGGRVSPSTVFRWCVQGTKRHGMRIKLEHFRAGSRVFTTRQALERYITELAGPQEQQATFRTPSERRRASQLAEQELIRQGA